MRKLLPLFILSFFLTACNEKKDILDIHSYKWEDENASIHVDIPFSSDPKVNEELHDYVAHKAHVFFGSDFYIPQSTTDADFVIHSQNLAHKKLEEWEQSQQALQDENITPPSMPFGFEFKLTATPLRGLKPFQVVEMHLFASQTAEAHPNHSVFFLNVNRETHEIVEKLSDIFTEEQQQAIARYAYGELKKSVGYIFLDNESELLSRIDGQFAVLPGGLQITFPPYVVAAYAVGTPTIHVPDSVYKR